MIRTHTIRRDVAITEELEIAAAYVIPTTQELIYVFKTKESNKWYEYNWKAGFWNEICIIPATVPKMPPAHGDGREAGSGGGKSATPTLVENNAKPAIRIMPVKDEQ